jgi:AcrR family transcriptional regulator
MLEIDAPMKLSSPGVPRRLPGRPRSVKADRAILDAALALFVEHGFDNVSIDDIAARAGVGRATVYRRWSSKAALIAEAIASERGDPELAIDALAGSPRHIFDSLALTLTAPDMKQIMARLIGASVDHPELIAAYWRTYMEPRRMAVLSLLQAAQARGQLPPDADVSIVLDVISGAIAHQVLVRPGERTADEIKSHLLAVLRELGIDPASPTSKTRRQERRS